MSKTVEWENIYKAQMDKIRFSEDKKKDILKKLTASGKEGELSNVIEFSNASQKNVKMKRTLKPAAVAAVIAGVVGAGSFGVCAATGVIPVAEAFKNVYEIPTSSGETVEKIGKSIGSSVVSGGVRITADAVIGDRQHCAVVYSLEKVDGSAFDMSEIKEEDGYLKLSFERSDGNLDIDDVDAIGYSSSGHFEVGDKSNNKIQYVEIYNCDVDIIGGHIEVSFKDLISYDIDSDANMNKKTIANGTWKFDIPLQYEDSGHLYRMDERLSYNDEPVYLESLSVSAIGYELRYRSYELVPAYLIMKDGTEINMLSDGMTDGYTEFETLKSMKYSFSSMFKKIIDPADVKSVRIADREFDLCGYSEYQGSGDELENELSENRDKIFTEPNKGLFYFEIMYEGDDDIDWAGIYTDKENSPVGSIVYASSNEEFVKKGESIFAPILRSNSVIKYDDYNYGEVSKRYSLEDLSFRISLSKNDEELASFNFDDIVNEFGKVYKIRITGNKNSGYKAEYLGKEDIQGDSEGHIVEKSSNYML